MELYALVTDEMFDSGLSCEYDNIKLMSCDDNECTITNGYVKYNQYIGLKCDLNNCSEIPNSADCEKEKNTIFYSGNTFSVCSNIINNMYSEIELSKENNYTFIPESVNSLNYKLVILNENGTILTFSTLGIIYFFNIYYIFIHLSFSH